MRGFDEGIRWDGKGMKKDDGINRDNRERDKESEKRTKERQREKEEREAGDVHFRENLTHSERSPYPAKLLFRASKSTRARANVTRSSLFFFLFNFVEEKRGFSGTRT